MTTTTDPLAPGRTSYRLLFILAAVVFALDQATKLWIVHLSGFPHGFYPPFGGMEIIPGFFSLVYTTNAGAAWGILEGRGSILLGIAVIALGTIYFFRRELELSRTPMQLAFGLIIGGILGNSLDRLVHGHVIDFLDVHLGFYRWPTFNIADSGIVVGCAFYIYLSFRSPGPPPEPTGQQV
ncbi:MAG: signal peptidase II [Opitutales bacterium]|nr:signal peptidase II [Opitutales bacterium]